METVLIETLEQFRQFINEDGFIEIVTRGKYKRLQKYFKIVLKDLPKSEAKEKVSEALRNITANSEKSLTMLKGIQGVQNANLVLNGINLCATCAGFAIMYAKLDKMSGEIRQQFEQLQNTVKQSNDVQGEFEFNKALSEHTDMLDCRKRQQPYPADKMRELVDREFNVLSMLISIQKKGISAGTDEMITAIFSLLSMLTVSLRYFDEQYYFDNRETLSGEDVWHSSHSRWMSVYDTLSEPWFTECLQDHYIFDADLSTAEADACCGALLEQVSDCREEVEDNRKLILALGDIDALRTLREKIAGDVHSTIQETLDRAFSGDADPAVQQAYHAAMQQAAFA